MKTLNSPVEFSKEVETSSSVARMAGNLLASPPKHTAKKLTWATEKGDQNVQHHAIVTPYEITVQEVILENLSLSHPRAMFLVEEKCLKFQKSLITDSNLSMLGNGVRFGIDPVDGSSWYANGGFDWSTSVGVMKDNNHLGGCIFSPSVFEGFTVTGERERGVIVSEGKREYPGRVRATRPLKQCVVGMGPDIFFLRQYSDFLHATGEKVRTVTGAVSVALALALVAAGKLDALVEPVQCPWDWFAGYPLVVEAGGEFLFYHYRDGVPTRVDKPDLKSYSPTKRNIAFIAGNRILVEHLFKLLQDKWLRT